MSPRLSPDPQADVRFPRVSGDEPDELRKMVSDGKFSPRERG